MAEYTAPPPFYVRLIYNDPVRRKGMSVAFTVMLLTPFFTGLLVITYAAVTDPIGLSEVGCLHLFVIIATYVLLSTVIGTTCFALVEWIWERAEGNAVTRRGDHKGPMAEIDSPDYLEELEKMTHSALVEQLQPDGYETFDVEQETQPELGTNVHEAREGISVEGIRNLIESQRSEANYEKDLDALQKRLEQFRADVLAAISRQQNTTANIMDQKELEPTDGDLIDLSSEKENQNADNITKTRFECLIYDIEIIE